jgi:WD40 repeat protein
VAFHSDGRWAFSGGSDGVVRVWDTGTMFPRAALRARDQVLRVAVVSEPGGKLVLRASDVSTAMMRWDAQTLQPLGSPRLGRPVQCFSPDGRYGLWAHAGQHPWLFDFQAGLELKRFPDALPPKKHGGCAFSADGKKALVAVKEGQFALLETATGKELWRFHGAPGVMARLATTANARHVLSIDEAGHAWLWDASANRIVRRFVPNKGGAFLDGALSADGRRALLLTRFGQMELWDLQADRRIHSLGAAGDAPTTLAMTADGRRALTGHVGGRVRLWDLERGEERCPCPDSVLEANCVALSRDGRHALSGHRDLVRLYDVVSGQVDKTLHEKGGWIHAVAFSPDGSRFAYGGLNGKLYLRQTDTKGLLWPAQPAHSPWVRALVFSPDGRRLYSGGGDPYRPSLEVGAIRVWDTETGKLLDKLRGHTAPVWCLALSPDGKRLLSGAGDIKSQDCTVRLWDTASGKELKPFDGHKAPVTCVAFAPDRKHAVSVSHLQTILWDLEAPPAKKARRDLTLGSGVVTFVDERHFVHAGWANRLLVCDLDGKIIKEGSLPHAVNGLAPSKDRKYLATANSNGTVYILRLPLRPPH